MLLDADEEYNLLSTPSQNSLTDGVTESQWSDLLLEISELHPTPRGNGVDQFTNRVAHLCCIIFAAATGTSRVFLWVCKSIKYFLASSKIRGGRWDEGRAERFEVSGVGDGSASTSRWKTCPADRRKMLC